MTFIMAYGMTRQGSRMPHYQRVLSHDVTRRSHDSASPIRLSHVPCKCVMNLYLAVDLQPVCCSVMQCVAAYCRALNRAAACCSVLQRVAVCCSVLQCAAACCSVLQRVAVCSSVLQCVLTFENVYLAVDSLDGALPIIVECGFKSS